MINPTNSTHLGLVRLRPDSIQTGSNKYSKKNMIDTMRDRDSFRVRNQFTHDRNNKTSVLVPHLLTSGLIPGLLLFLS